ncbi:MAG: helix-turn-helix domain-containing protein [Candidatus Aenigmarchaeota archaeon]|nr:helix-turn-helix domain-containing protein [Candidatus Aenigmarchaeota archaeon]
MKPFCEVIVQDILPALRALMAKELMSTHNLTQQEVAKKLGISQAAVSQYRREMRGFKIKLLQKDKEIMDSVEKLATRIASEDVDTIGASDECCLICKSIRNKKLICELHMEAAPNFEGCKTCFKC